MIVFRNGTEVASIQKRDLEHNRLRSRVHGDQKSLLVAVDNSEASMRAASYVVHLIGVERGFCIRLMHVLPVVLSEL